MSVNLVPLEKSFCWNEIFKICQQITDDHVEAIMDAFES